MWPSQSTVGTEEIDVEFLRLVDIEHAYDRDCGEKLYALADAFGRVPLVSVTLGCQDVPVVEAELLGNEFQALGN